MSSKITGMGCSDLQGDSLSGCSQTEQVLPLVTMIQGRGLRQTALSSVLVDLKYRKTIKSTYNNDPHTAVSLSFAKVP